METYIGKSPECLGANSKCSANCSASPKIITTWVCRYIYCNRLIINLYQRWESNPHSRRNTILSRARLPIPPLRLAAKSIAKRKHRVKVAPQRVRPALVMVARPGVSKVADQRPWADHRA